jgi:hypothetical protein
MKRKHLGILGLQNYANNKMLAFSQGSDKKSKNSHHMYIIWKFKVEE